MDPRIFYISSFGGSATEWLSKAISMHPDLVCFHGTRSVPPVGSGTNDLEVNVFMDALIQCCQACIGQKIFGACHGFYGDIAKEPVEKRGGVFAAVIRHPIRTIHSLFSHHCETQYGLKHADLYGVIAEHNALINKERFHDKGINLTNIESLFSGICHGTINYDLACINATDTEHLFFMEKFVSNRDYFEEIIRLVTNGTVAIKKPYLDAVFAQGKANVHSRSDISLKDLFEKWPPLFKIAYLFTMHGAGGITMHNKYIELGYEQPQYTDTVVELDGKEYIANFGTFADSHTSQLACP